MQRSLFCLLLAILLASCTHSADVAAARTPDSSPAGDLQYLVGSWLATGEDPRTGTTFTMPYRVEPVLGGTWLSGSATAPDLGLEIRDLWGRDPATGEIVRTIFQSNGNYGTVRSPGWDGEVLRLAGEVSTKDGLVQVRETITRVGPSEFRAVWEALLGGKWTVYSIERVVRQ